MFAKLSSIIKFMLLGFVRLEIHSLQKSKTKAAPREEEKMSECSKRPHKAKVARCVRKDL